MPGDLYGRTGLPRGGPNGGPKLWVAAHGPRALRLTGTFADGWLPTASTPQVYAEQYEIVKDAAQRADRPAPIGSLCPLVLFAQSHEQAVAALEEVPLAKLIMLVAPASLWAKHGLEHPHGPECRGFPDFLPHALDPEELRVVASRIPIEMVEDFVMIGDAHDVAARLKAFGDAGLEHVVLCDLTGLAFPPQVAAANLGQIATLCDIMHDPR
jgi:phthiodiolone/phenolphthiodiolone dimycocerosates ketoreductase